MEMAIAMTPTQALSEAMQLYFNLMYDCDVSNLERVFAATAQLHGSREGSATISVTYWQSLLPTNIIVGAFHWNRFASSRVSVALHRPSDLVH